MALLAQYWWQSRCNSSCAVSSLLCNSPTYICLCASVRTGSMRAWRECCHESVRIQLRSSCLCASSHGGCGWCATRDRAATTFSRPMQRSNTTWSDPIPGTRSILQEQSSSSFFFSRFLAFLFVLVLGTALIHTIGKAVCSPFSTCAVPGTSNQPHPEGEGYIIRTRAPHGCRHDAGTHAPGRAGNTYIYKMHSYIQLLIVRLLFLPLFFLLSPPLIWWCVFCCGRLVVDFASFSLLTVRRQLSRFFL